MSSSTSSTEPSFAGVVAAKRQVKKLVTKKKSGTSKTKADSSPERRTDPADDPSTPHSPLYGLRSRHGSRQSLYTESPEKGSPTHHASPSTDWKTLSDSIINPEKNKSHMNAESIATVDSMRTALRNASERLKEQDARVSESLSVAVMVKVERDAIVAERDELAQLNKTLRERIVSADADVASTRLNITTARNELRDALAQAAKAKMDSKLVADRHRLKDSDASDSQKSEIEKARRDADAVKFEARNDVIRANEDASALVEDANHRANEAIQQFKKESETARVELQRARDDAGIAVADVIRRGEEKLKIAKRDAEAFQNEARRNKSEVETVKAELAEAGRMHDRLTRLITEATMSKESAVASSCRDAQDARDAQSIAEENLEKVTSKLRQVENAFQQLKAENEVLLTVKQGSESELKATLDTAQRQRDVAIETRDALERALVSERDQSRKEVFSLNEIISNLRNEVAEHKRKAKDTSELVASVERKLHAIESEGPAREAVKVAKAETESIKRENDALREKLDATRDDAFKATERDIAERRLLQDQLMEARDTAGVSNITHLETQEELKRWQCALHERDVVIDSLRLAMKDSEVKLESSRIEALEARRLGVTAEANARVAIENFGRHKLIANNTSSHPVGYSVSYPPSPVRSRDQSTPVASPAKIKSNSSPLSRGGSPSRDLPVRFDQDRIVQGSGDGRVKAFVKTQPRGGW